MLQNIGPGGRTGNGGLSQPVDDPQGLVGTGCGLEPAANAKQTQKCKSRRVLQERRLADICVMHEVALT